MSGVYELPGQLRTPEGRREFFRQARRQLQPEQEPSEPGVELGTEPCEEVPLELDAEEIVGRGRQGRDAWLREGKRQLEQHRWEAPDPVSRSREERLLLAAERLGNALDVERRADEVDAVLAELAPAGIPRRPEAIAADAGYWNEQQMDEVVANRHIPVLVAPDKGSRTPPSAG